MTEVAHRRELVHTGGIAPAAAARQLTPPPIAAQGVSQGREHAPLAQARLPSAACRAGPRLEEPVQLAQHAARPLAAGRRQ